MNITYSEQAAEAVGKADENVKPGDELDETMRRVPNRRMRRDAMRQLGQRQINRSRVRRRFHRIRRQKTA